MKPSKKSWDSGHVSGDRLKLMLDDYKAESISTMGKKMEEIKKIIENLATNRGVSNNDDDDVVNVDEFEPCEDRREEGSIFQYDGKFFGVPKNFNFPSCTLKQGLRFWLFGQSADIEGNRVVRPFRKLKTSLLPLGIRNKFKINWCPIFRYLEDRVPLPINTITMTEAEFDAYFGDCVDLLKNRVSYAFSKKGEKGEKRTLALSVAAWSRLVLKSLIIKNGNDHDKSFINSPAQIF